MELELKHLKLNPVTVTVTPVFPENFLSALIRPPSRPEPIAPEYTLAAQLDRSMRNSPGPPDRPPQDNPQEQAGERQE